MEVFTVTFGNVKDKVNSSLIPQQVIFRVKKPSEEQLQPPKDGMAELRELSGVLPNLLHCFPLARDLNAKCHLFL